MVATLAHNLYPSFSKAKKKNRFFGFGKKFPLSNPPITNLNPNLHRVDVLATSINRAKCLSFLTWPKSNPPKNKMGKQNPAR